MDYREILEERIQDSKAILDEHYPEWRNIDPDRLHMDSRSTCIGGHLRGDYLVFMRELKALMDTDYFLGGVILNEEDDGSVYHGLGFSKDLVDWGINVSDQFDYLNMRWKEMLREEVEVQEIFYTCPLYEGMYFMGA